MVLPCFPTRLILEVCGATASGTTTVAKMVSRFCIMQATGITLRPHHKVLMHPRYGTLGHLPAGQHKPDEKRQIWDWDSGKYLGEIDEVPYTYNVP